MLSLDSAVLAHKFGRCQGHVKLVVMPVRDKTTWPRGVGPKSWEGFI